MKDFFKSKIWLSVVLLNTLIFMGMLGYRYISDFKWLDALYMSVITVTTVGYGEITPLGPAGRIFTMFLLLASLFIIGFSLRAITEELLANNTLFQLRKKKLTKIIRRMEKQVIICGYGRNGAQVAAKLQSFHMPFVVIDKNESVAQRIGKDIVFIQGDANDDDVLLTAGIERAGYLIAALPDDASNLYLVLSARQLNPKLVIISRASDPSACKKLTLAGADQVVLPERIGGDHMASLVADPDLITFMDRLGMGGKEKTNLVEISLDTMIDERGASTLRDLNLRHKTGCTVIGYISESGQYIINPEADQLLDPKGKIIVLGRSEQIDALHQVFSF